MLPLPASHHGECFPWPQGSGRELLPAVEPWNAPSKMPSPVLQPASLQAKLPCVIKAEVLIQAQESLQSFCSGCWVSGKGQRDGKVAGRKFESSSVERAL